MDYYNEVSTILDKNKENILGNPVREAIEGIKKTVDDLTRAAGLPSSISDTYKKFAEDEGLLYTSDSYRDHFFHPFHTFLLGFIILNKLRKLDQRGKSPFPTDDDFLTKWLVSSLWHDVTYIAEKGPEWLEAFIEKRLDIKIKATQDWAPIISDKRNIKAINRICLRFESQDEERRLDFQSWVSKQLTEKYHDHGILSSILLLREGETWTKDKGITNDFIDDCSLAVALHNYHRAYNAYLADVEELHKKQGRMLDNVDREDNNLKEKIDSPLARIKRLEIKRYPLAFLLAYCDTAQEWGRPSIRNPVDYLEYDTIDVKMKSKLKIFVLYAYDVYEKNYSNGKETLKSRLDILKKAWKHDENKFQYGFRIQMHLVQIIDL